MCSAVTGFCLLAVSCEKQGETVTVEETRKVTTKDVEPKLFATSAERFENAKPGPVEGDAPESWVALPKRQFRDLNYKFGESGLGEVYVSIVSGGVMENANRWIKQFGAEPLDAEGIAALDRVPMAGAEGVWVEAEGDFGGMGGAGSKPGYGLAGVIAKVDGKLMTLKMVGPAEEVEKEKEALKAFASSLELTD